jgi:hypothetical protein
VGLKLVKVSRPALEGLSLTKDDVLVLADDLDREIAQNANLFQM